MMEARSRACNVYTKVNAIEIHFPPDDDLSISRRAREEGIKASVRHVCIYLKWNLSARRGYAPQKPIGLSIHTDEFFFLPAASY